MARGELRIYRSRRPLRTALTVIFTLLLVLILLAVAVFFGFRRYITYTNDGVKLVVPWLGYPEEDFASGDTGTGPEGDLPAPESTGPEGSQP